MQAQQQAAPKRNVEAAFGDRPRRTAVGPGFPLRAVAREPAASRSTTTERHSKPVIRVAIGGRAKVLYIGTKGPDHAHRTAFHQDGTGSLCGYRFPQGAFRDQEPGRLGGVPARRHRRAGPVQPGCDRHPGPEIFPQGRRAGAAEAGRGERRPRPSCGAPCPTRRRWPSCPRRSATAPRPTPARSSTGWPAPGPIGAGRAAISTARKTRAPSATSSPTCSPPSASRPIRRNGSTPACTGPMASTAPARAISMSTRSPAS